MVVPPAGWRLALRKADTRHIHKVWISPSGATAYGVIFFHLPFPVGPDLALLGFLQQMKIAEGAANLITRSDDAALPGVRFVADGTHYRIRAKLTTAGFEGWTCYAGTRLDRPVNEPELDVDVMAREQTPLP